MNNKSFMMDWNLVNSRAYSNSVDDVNLRQKRYGHVNNKSLNQACKTKSIEKNNKGFDDLHVTSIKPINETYHRCDLTVLELANIEEIAREKCDFASSPKCKL